jgi:hypothetical protein
MANVERFRTDNARRPRRLLCHDVDRAGHRAGGPDFSWPPCSRPNCLWPLPILGVWLAAPWIAWWISQPIESAAPDLTAEQLTFLRRTARKTWHFFETFVTAQENWLPPDNFQEVPVPTIASRTSPTNMGLALLANLAAGIWAIFRRAA